MSNLHTPSSFDTDPGLVSNIRITNTMSFVSLAYNKCMRMSETGILNFPASYVVDISGFLILVIMMMTPMAFAIHREHTYLIYYKWYIFLDATCIHMYIYAVSQESHIVQNYYQPSVSRSDESLEFNLLIFTNFRNNVHAVLRVEISCPGPSSLIRKLGDLNDSDPLLASREINLKRGQVSVRRDHWT